MNYFEAHPTAEIEVFLKYFCDYYDKFYGINGYSVLGLPSLPYTFHKPVDDELAKRFPFPETVPINNFGEYVSCLMSGFKRNFSNSIVLIRDSEESERHNKLQDIRMRLVDAKIKAEVLSDIGFYSVEETVIDMFKTLEVEVAMFSPKLKKRQKQRIPRSEESFEPLIDPRLWSFKNNKTFRQFYSRLLDARLLNCDYDAFKDVLSGKAKGIEWFGALNELGYLINGFKERGLTLDPIHQFKAADRLFSKNDVPIPAAKLKSDYKKLKQAKKTRLDSILAIFNNLKR
jgi:hypothetical protein